MVLRDGLTGLGLNSAAGQTEEGTSRATTDHPPDIWGPSVTSQGYWRPDDVINPWEPVSLIGWLVSKCILLEMNCVFRSQLLISETDKRMIRQCCPTVGQGMEK